MSVQGPYEIIKYYICLSTDTKPTVDVHCGDELFESDTRNWYVYSPISGWCQKTGPEIVSGTGSVNLGSNFSTSGTTYIISSTGSVTFTLPSGAPVGTWYTVMKPNTGTLIIQCPTGNTVDGSTSAGTSTCADSGLASITLVCIATNKWQSTSKINTWTVST